MYADSEILTFDNDGQLITSDLPFYVPAKFFSIPSKTKAETVKRIYSNL